MFSNRLMAERESAHMSSSENHQSPFLSDYTTYCAEFASRGFLKSARKSCIFLWVDLWVITHSILGDFLYAIFKRAEGVESGVPARQERALTSLGWPRLEFADHA